MNLAVSDLLMSSTQAPICFLNSFNRQWILGEIGNKPFCHLHYFATSFTIKKVEYKQISKYHLQLFLYEIIVL